MWSGEWSIWQSEDRDDQEEDSDTNEASDNVTVQITCLVTCESCPRDATNTDKHQHESVRFVEELQADVIHWSLIDADKVIRGIRTLRSCAQIPLSPCSSHIAAG